MGSMVRAPAVCAALAAVACSAGAQTTPVTLEYHTTEQPLRYIFSQTGWQDMVPPPPSTGNVYAGFIDHRVDEVNEDGSARHRMVFTQLGASFLLPGDYHVWQDASAIVGHEAPYATRPDHPTTVDLPPAEAGALPAIRGIPVSPLLNDLPTALPPLPGRPVSPGDQWTASERHTIPTTGQDGTVTEREMERTLTLTFAGVEARPSQFSSQDSVDAVKVTGTGTLVENSRRGEMVVRMDEEIELVAWFDTAAGRWLEVTYTTRSDMTIEGPGFKREGPMGYTNHFRFVR